jgi:cutinase
LKGLIVFNIGSRPGAANGANGTASLGSARHVLGRRALIGIYAVIAASGMLFASTALPAGWRAIASASADACPNVQVVFARGTAEPAGVGRVGQAFVDSLQPMLGGKSMSVYAVDYPASYNFLRATDGANDASAFVQNIATTCPDTRIVLGGYSQGAAIVDIITMGGQPMFGFANPMPPDIARHVAAVAVFGNPSNRISGPLSALTPLYGDKTIDLCNGDDPVCSSGNDVRAHSFYVEAGMANQAASFVAQKLSAPTHALQDTAAHSSDPGAPSGTPDETSTAQN